MKSYLNTSFLLLLLFALITSGIVSCERNVELINEPVKNISGTWKLSKVLRNSSDITEWVDSGAFRITLQDNNAYTIEGNNIPFVVNSNGKWAVDDPQYPYNLSFTPDNDANNTITAEIGAAVIKGQRSLNVNFSPGCRSNQYVYVFEKVN